MAFQYYLMAVCLALFTAAAVIWLLDMIGKVTIRTSAQRVLLNAALGTTLIGGIASYAVGAFFTTPGGLSASGGAGAGAPTPAASLAAAQPSASSSPTPSPSTHPSPSATATPAAPPTACRPAAHPDYVVEWAAAALGTPPTFRCAITAPYPGCIADVRELQLAEISREAALECGAQLRAFRQSHVSTAYAAKITYQDNLDAAEAGLRSPRDPEETGRRSYVIAEITRMNGVLWKDFTALDQRSKNDMLACQSETQRCLIES